MKIKKIKKTPVFFIATKIKQNPAVVNYYTYEGKKVESDEVKRKETAMGTVYFTKM